MTIKNGEGLFFSMTVPSYKTWGVKVSCAHLNTYGYLSLGTTARTTEVSKDEIPI